MKLYSKNDSLLGIIKFFVIILLFVSFSTLNENKLSVEYIPDVLADPVSDEAAIEGSCDNGVLTAFTPDLSYAFQIASLSLDGLPTCSSTLTLSGSVVNGDTDPTVTCSSSDEVGFFVGYSRSPNMKIGGLACNTEDRSNLAVHGDGTDNAEVDAGFDTTSATEWSDSKKVDNATSGSKDILFGTGGQVGTSPIVDGSDADTLTNGEVMFGGTTPSEGASRLFMKIDSTGDEHSGVLEILTFTFTVE